MAENNVKVHSNALTNRDIAAYFFRYWTLSEVCHSYTRMQGVSVGLAMIPILKKLYGPDRKEELSRALLRESMYYNCQCIWGSACLSVAIAMEEDVALNGSMTQDEADEAINGIKTGFMGPLASIGDTIDGGVLNTLLLGISMDLVQNSGLWYGALVTCFVHPLVTLTEGFIYSRIGYTVGKTALAQVFSSGILNKIIQLASIVGLTMMGALSATTVKFTFANATLQGTCDKILPGMVPLAIIFLTYWLFTKKKWPVARVAITYVVAGVVLALFGIV